MIGQKLAHYEITAHLGSGGMGEVYQATDTRLGRSVAIKILPEIFLRDAERVARFHREARVLASLNHPHIAAIHGLEEFAARTFLVMEMVSGQTVAERVAQGAFAIDEAMKVALQIADALEAAHEKGIVHRDLKPANIKITHDGKVKVLDFGLAKAFEAASSSPDLSNSPTLSMAATHSGVILGTAAYMSPEQARGMPMDPRTDIFSFGAVFYEMLTGNRPFTGQTVSDIVAAVLTVDPDWSRLPHDTPAAVQRLLHRCLQKDRNRRLHAVADARIEIEEAFLPLPRPPLAEGGARKARRSNASWLAAALAISAASFAILYFRPAPSPAAPEMRLEINTPPTTNPISFALSPDGNQLVFVASLDGTPYLWLRRLDAATAAPLAGTEGAAYPFWSPDGRSVGFFADANVRRIDIGGGQVQTLTDAAAARGGSWNADGVILFSSRCPVCPLFRIGASGGEATPVMKVENQNHRFPQFLPDGRQFLFYAATGTTETRGIYLSSLDSGEVKRLTAADAAGAYMPPGWLLWVRAGVLAAQRLDLERKQLAGDPVPLADSVAFDAAASVAAFSVSQTGQVAYRKGAASRRQLSWFDRSGRALGLLGTPDESGLSGPRVSPDGRRVTAYRTLQGNTDIWILDAARTSRFTFGATSERFPLWSPDGSWIVFDSTEKVRRDIHMKPASGAGDEELLVESTQDKVVSDWSTDGRFILYHSTDPQTSQDLWVLPLEGDRKPWVFLKTNFSERQGHFSPDGRWVAYMPNESGRPEIYVRPFTQPAATTNRAAGQWQASTMGGIFPKWRPDGRELYYIAPDGKLMAVSIAVSGQTLEPGPPVALFATRILGGGTDSNQGRQYDVSRDGRFLINTVLDDATTSPITLLLNWKPPPPD
jgi:eukaryotic-like serine/threonine-protein kinase